MKRSPAILFILFFIFAQTPVALGGFGITPPYVQNDNLTRTSQFQQKIILVRSNPDEDLKATVTVNVPGANEWISVDRGLEFVLPKEERQIPMLVTVHVPEDAKFGRYTGSMRVVISSVEGPQAGTVGISLGAQIDVSLDVVDRKIFEFKIRGINVLDLEEGHTVWWMFFPGKIRFYMKVQNTGNVPSSPSRIEMDVYDAAGKKLLESIRNTNKIKFVDPFKTEEVVAELPTRLPAGTYRIKYRIFNLDTLVQENEVPLTILPYGSIPGYEGYGIWGLRLRDKVILGIGAVAALGLLAWSVVALVRFIRKRKGERRHTRAFHHS